MKFFKIGVLLLVFSLAACESGVGRRLLSMAPGVTGGGAACEGVGPQAESVPGAQSFSFTSVPGRDLKLHVFEPAAQAGAAKPAILLFFGGRWRSGKITSFQEQARAYTALGYVAVLADYRVRCRDGSTPLDSVDDAQAAYAWLRTHAGQLGIDRRRIVLGGGSSGGHLALVTAMKAPASEKPAALVLFNPAVDLVSPAAFYLKLVARGISPSVLSVEDLPPTVIFHGQADSIVPVQSVRDFCARATAAGRVCSVFEYAGQEHGFFHHHQGGPDGAPAPYDDTLAKSVSFLGGLRLLENQAGKTGSDPVRGLTPTP